MSPTTPSSKRCSGVSGPACILEPRASRILGLWLLATHGVAVAAVLALAVPWLLKPLLLAGIAAHACARRPGRPERLVRDSSGGWALPERGLADLFAAPGSRFGRWWAYLVLSDGSEKLRILLLRDQFDSETWRRLQAALRRRPGISGLP
ncbi:MAG TPA: protein YgfX [Gammaproteobacteria bacterium]